MGTDVMLQFGILVFTLCIFYLLHLFPKKDISKSRSRNRPNIQVDRHLLTGAEFLKRARALQNKKNSASINLVRSAITEINKALALQPKKSGAYVLKARALDIMGHKNAALKMIDVALSPSIVKGLSDREKGDALFSRAQLQIAMNKNRRVDSAMSDLVQSVQLNPDNAQAFYSLGLLYEAKKLYKEAKNGYSKALEIDPDLVEARQALSRLSP